jgi:hypothetical protein
VGFSRLLRQESARKARKSERDIVIGYEESEETAAGTG